MTSFADRVRGCLVGGAVGDALGAQVELLSWAQIQEQFGPDGVSELAPDSPFTDDTQMTLFTVEGLIRANVRGRTRGISGFSGVVQRSYHRWWWTQEQESCKGQPPPTHIRLNGWLVHDSRLHLRRGPGKTCLAALASGEYGTVTEPINNSKGSGAVMRAAPAGLFCHRDESRAYELGCEIGALTHGHPDGWGPSGALAHLVSLLVQEVALAEAVSRTVEISTGNTSFLLRRAVETAASGQITAETIERDLGSGWVGDQALAIAVACALGFEAPEQALLAAVNHSGDSDSTGAVCGNILGAAHGEQAVPCRWAAATRDLDLVRVLAEDLMLEAAQPPQEDWGHQFGPPQWWALRYPEG